MIDEHHSQISVRRQCELVDLNGSSYYYKPAATDAYTQQLLNLMDEEYTRHPYYGSRRMVAYLRSLGHDVNRKRIQRLYKLLGIEAIYPKKKLSQANPEHKKFPYLLRDVSIERVNQVWSTDITYIRLKRGFVYLVAIIDWYSRYVLDWELSNSLEADFCIETLERVLENGCCEVFNTNQGSQFTTPHFTDLLLEKDIKVSMDGKGRALDNIFVERLWRSLKQELIYRNEMETIKEAKQMIGNYFEFYNHERFHQALNYKCPVEIYKQ